MEADAHSITGRTLEATGESTPLERILWILVFVSLVGDIVTTVIGLQLGLSESNPVARQAIDGFGIGGLLGLKLIAVGIAIACRPLLPVTYRPIIPAGLAIPWTIAMVANLGTIWIVI